MKIYARTAQVLDWGDAWTSITLEGEEQDEILSALISALIPAGFELAEEDGTLLEESDDE